MIWSVQVLKEECVSVTPANASSKKTSLLLYVSRVYVHTVLIVV